MNQNARFALVCSVLMSFALSMASMPVAALDRSGGDYWMYDASMKIEVGEFGLVEISGWVKYSYDGKDTVTIGSTDYGASVMKLEGELTGSLIIAPMAVVVSGYSYESKDGIATVKDDVTLLMNASMDIGGFVVQLFEMTTESESTYSPPYISGFEPGDTGTGDSWSESVSITTTSAIYLNDTLLFEDTSTDDVTYDMDVASAKEKITTPAGTFSTLVLTVTDTDSGDYEKYWVSEKVRNIVKKESWEAGADEPYETLALSEYKVSILTMILIIAVGIGVAVAAVVALALVLRRRRSKAATAPPPQAPPVQ